MTSLLKIDTGSSRAEAPLTERANEQSHVLRERDTGSGSWRSQGVYRKVEHAMRGRAPMNSLT